MSRPDVKKGRIYMKKRRICMILAGVMVKNVGYI